MASPKISRSAAAVTAPPPLPPTRRKATTTRRSTTSRVRPKPDAVAEARVPDVDKAAMLLPFPDALWIEGNYVAPIAFLRSALFAVIKKGSRRELKNATLASWAGTTITFTGTQLDQSDADVFFAMVRKARDHGLGPRVTFSMRELLRELGWDSGGKSVHRLRDSFDRLFNCSVVVETEHVQYKGHLVDSIRHDKKDEDSYYFRLNADMVGFFNMPEYVRIAISHRRQIRGMLAKWLHSYLEAHPGDVVMTIEDVIRLSGSAAENRTKFRSTLRHALGEIQEADIILSWRMEQSSVFIQKRSSRLLPV